MSYVRRPNRNASARWNTSPTYAPPSSSSSGRAHPPRSNPPLRSSSGPPSPCITPSTETCVIVVSFMRAAPVPLSFDPTQAEGMPSGIGIDLVIVAGIDVLRRFQHLRTERHDALV